MKMSGVYPIHLAASCAVAAICVSAPAMAQVRTFDIPAGAAAEGIRDLSRQASVQIMAPAKLLAKRRTNAVKGTMEVPEAVRQLISQTGLTVVSDDGVIVIGEARAALPAEPTPPRDQPVRPGAAAGPASLSGEAMQSEPTAATNLPELVVTGSRIARRDYSSSSPIVTIDSEAIMRSGSVTLERTFTQLPQFTPSFGAASAFPSRGGQTNINLRGLGTNRALVLVDGRRIQPANADGTVDINVIPNQAIESVETITGGASSTYGSDAMAGVVNIKLKRKFEGLMLDAQVGLTDRGDGATQSISGMFGAKFADGRGSLLVSTNYTNRHAIFRKDRAFFERSTLLGFLPSGTVNLAANVPSQAAVDAVFGGYGAAAGAINGTRALGINTDGTLYTAAPSPSPVFNYRGPLDDFIQIFNNNLVENSGMTYHLQIPLQRYSGFGRLEYELTDNVRAYADGFYTTYKAQAQISNTALGLQGQIMNVPVTNPFLPADLRTLLASRAAPDADFPLNYLFTQFGPQSFNTKWETYQVTAGLTGTLPSLGWSWEVYGSQGQTDAHESRTNNVSLTAVRTLLRAPDGGASVCTGGLNLFGLQPISDSCLAYIGRVPSTRTRLKQQVIEGTVQGGIAELPAGDIRFALGGDYRRNSYALTPDADLVAGTIAGSPPTLPSAGAQSVYEGYAEVLLPLIHETPLVKRLDVTLGYRYSRYNRLGGAHTYKADVDWTVVENLKLRGGYSRAIRAPSLADLYAARNTVNVTVGSPLGAGGAATFNGDPCDVRGLYRQGANAAAIKTLCLAQGVPAAQIDSFIYSSTNIVGTNEGNPNLHEEKADTFSVGAVVRSPFSSPWVSGLRASVDYYNIRIKDAVGQLSTATSIARCFNGDGVSNPSFDPANAYCGYIRRDALGNPTQGIIPTLNLASYKTAGVDLQLDWSLDLGNVGVGVNAGRIDLNFAGTLLDEFSVVSLPGAQAQDFAGYTSGAISGGVLPKFRSFTSASYTLGGATLGLRWRHLSSVQDASKVTNPASAIAGVRAYDYFDLFFRGQVSPRFELRGGINNLADKGPPAIGTAPGATDTNSYDVVGRSFFLGVRASF